ncbi:MAG TPA: DUF5069 domain-containing protein [Chloroflexota bacterium]|nr:DUF5069 domain-containing protein [Chloroflexota bacterium]
MDYDFTRAGSYPRSGRETLGGVVFLPRTIDKMRAHLAGTAGEYNATGGLSSRLFNLYGVSAEDFSEAVRQSPGDEGVLRWLQEHGSKQPSADEITQYNEGVLGAGPQNDEGRARFRANLERLGFGDRTDVTTHVDAEDLEEGRDVPHRDAA